MVDITAVFRAIDAMTPEERQKVLEYLKRPSSEPTESLKPRIAGLHEHLGHAWMSDDFNDELPDSFWFGDDKE